MFAQGRHVFARIRFTVVIGQKRRDGIFRVRIDRWFELVRRHSVIGQGLVGYIDVKIVRSITRCLVHHVDAPQYSNANDWGVLGTFSYYSSSRGALSPSADSSAWNGSKKRPRVEKISSSRYRAYDGMRDLVHAPIALVDAIASRPSFAAGSFFGTARIGIVLA